MASSARRFTPLQGPPLTWNLDLGPQRFCSAVEPRCRLLGDGSQRQWPRVCVTIGTEPHTSVYVALTDLAPCSFVEFETAADLKSAVEKLDGREFKGQRVTCIADVGFLQPFLLSPNYVLT